MTVQHLLAELLEYKAHVQQDCNVKTNASELRYDMYCDSVDSNTMYCSTGWGSDRWRIMYFSFAYKYKTVLADLIYETCDLKPHYTCQ